MSVSERDPAFLISKGYLEKCKDFTHEGQSVLAARLGYRITARFVRTFFGRVFNHPHLVFTDKMLRPETQDVGIFADGMANIVATQKSVAESYFADGSIDLACPPLRALLHIMRSGESKDLHHPKVRGLFTREAMLGSDWYKERLAAKQMLDCSLWTRHATYLEAFLAKSNYSDEAIRLGIKRKLDQAAQSLKRLRSGWYLERLEGTLGVNPLQPAGVGTGKREHSEPDADRTEQREAFV